MPSVTCEKMHLRQRVPVIGVPIDAISWEKCIALLLEWASACQSRYVCICNVHSVVTASNDSAFRSVIVSSDLATPDGFPIAWTLRRKGYPDQERVNGPDLMLKLCKEAQRMGMPIGLLGGSEFTLNQLKDKLSESFPELSIPYYHSPPFRELTDQDNASICDAVNASGAGLLFVGLGCPKQEIWMARQRGQINAVMIGVGAAFDYHAGIITRAPDWMQAIGLEWLFRLMSEPRRLWRRYLVGNSTFILKSVADLMSPASGTGRSR